MGNEYKSHRLFYRRNLPHIQPPDALIFVTYRLAFTLPEEILKMMNDYETRLCRKKVNRIKLGKLMFDAYDIAITKIDNSRDWLRNPDIAHLVIDDLLANHTKRYELLCTLIMPNHVHTLLKPLLKLDQNWYSLAAIMKYHKNFTANKANKILGRRGQFWHHESYDHFVRNENELYNIIWYILFNPVKAGLVDDYKSWPYYWINEKFKDVII